MLDVSTLLEWLPGRNVHPGAVIQEHLEARSLSQAEFARLAGMSPKLLSALISGNHSISAKTAKQLERVLGVESCVWHLLQARWDAAQGR
jgi:HTH-type transcriptional regulator/antitoxin HigA